MIKLLKQLAQHGRTVICTIHQPSAKLFEKFDVVYVLAYGQCLYQGHSSKLVPFLHSVQMPCPKFHNPADFAIELASAEYGMDKVKTLINSIDNGENLSWFVNYNKPKQQHKHPIQDERSSSYEVSEFHQLKVLLTRCVIKAKRDQTLTHLRIAVNIIIAALLGWLFIGSGNDGSRVLDNYNLLFSILMHHMMTPMMMTILTCELGRWWRRFLINFLIPVPTERSTILKENFNRWYTVKAYYLAVNIIDLPISTLSCFLFSIIIYVMTGWPLEFIRFSVFFVVSLLVVLVAETVGLIIGSCFNVIVSSLLTASLFLQFNHSIFSINGRESLLNPFLT